jgi:hypothetical protein
MKAAAPWILMSVPGSEDGAEPVAYFAYHRERRISGGAFASAAAAAEEVRRLNADPKAVALMPRPGERQIIGLHVEGGAR